MRADVHREFVSALGRVRGPAARWLRQYLDSWAFKAVGGFGLSRVAPQNDGLYLPDDHGFPAIIFPVLEWDELFDLVAWVPNRPGFLLRQGLGEVLGRDALDSANDALRIFPDPISWARASGERLCDRVTEALRIREPASPALPPDYEALLSPDRRKPAAIRIPFTVPPPAGIVILDWSVARFNIPSGCQLHVDSLQLGQMLREALTPPPPPVPAIFVSEGIAA